MTLELSSNETDALVELIDRRLTELKVEIHRTDKTSYREALDREYETLIGLQRRLGSVAV